MQVLVFGSRFRRLSSVGETASFARAVKKECLCLSCIPTIFVPLHA